jgi:hypothetical protein
VFIVGKRLVAVAELPNVFVVGQPLVAVAELPDAFVVGQPLLAFPEASFSGLRRAVARATGPAYLWAKGNP